MCDQEQALRLLESGQVTLARGAQLAGVSLEEFIEILGKASVAVVDYPPEELADELEAARVGGRGSDKC